MSEERKFGFDEDSDDDYHECILNPTNDRRIIICDSQNKSDGIIQCIVSIESDYIPDEKLKQTEKMHGTGTVIHMDDENNMYILTAAHNVVVAAKECQKCKTKTLKTYCVKSDCDSKNKTKKNGNLIKPTHIHISRRSYGVKHSLGQTVQRYQVHDYKYPEIYSKYPTPRGGYDMSILIAKCHDSDGITLYKTHSAKISLINDEQFGGKSNVLYIYGYPGEKRKEKDFRVYYYLFGMGTSKLESTHNFAVIINTDTNKQYIVNKGVDTTAGQSGSCIYSYNENDSARYLVYGIHSGGSQKRQANYGTFFDFGNIQWIANILGGGSKHLSNIICHYSSVSSLQLRRKNEEEIRLKNVIDEEKLKMQSEFDKLKIELLELKQKLTKVENELKEQKKENSKSPVSSATTTSQSSSKKLKKSQSNKKSKHKSSSSYVLCTKKKQFQDDKNKARGGFKIITNRRVRIDDGRIGVVKYKGRTAFGKSSEDWIGIVIEYGKGQHNGSVNGRSYFRCRDGKGMMCRPERIIEDLGNPMTIPLDDAMKKGSPEIQALLKEILRERKEEARRKKKAAMEAAAAKERSNYGGDIGWKPGKFDDYKEDHSTGMFKQKLMHSKTLLDKNKDVKAAKKKKVSEI
eukprot:185486_1